MRASGEPVERPRLLVVDDDETIRWLVSETLEAAGYDVRCVETGERAIAAASKACPDLVLLDIMLGRESGFDVLARLRDVPGMASVPVVFLTALTDFDVHRQAMDAAVDDFLMKPIRRAELVIRVRSLLRLVALNRSLVERNATIRAQQTELRRVQAQKDELVAMLVHDLKSPLAAIRAGADYVREHMLDDESREALADMEAAARSAHRRVCDLLDVARSEGAGLRVASQVTDLAEVVSRFAGRAFARARDVGVELRVALEPGQAIALADPDLCERVLENLIDNALKHSPAGGRVDLRARSDGQGVFVSVLDDGPGVPEPKREAIFGKFSQLGRDEDRGGHGLGLHFCRVAMRAQGGDVWVEPRGSQGSAFCLRFQPVLAVGEARSAPFAWSSGEV